MKPYHILAALFIAAATPVQGKDYKAAEAPHQTILENRVEVKCLADNIYHESRGEPEEGQLAVAWVTLNRVKTRGWPDTICGVVYQTGQFSWVGVKKDIRELDAYLESYTLAVRAIAMMEAGHIPKPVRGISGALYFNSLPTKFDGKGFKKIGRHSFYINR